MTLLHPGPFPPQNPPWHQWKKIILNSSDWQNTTCHASPSGCQTQQYRPPSVCMLPNNCTITSTSNSWHSVTDQIDETVVQVCNLGDMWKAPYGPGCSRGCWTASELWRRVKDWKYCHPTWGAFSSQLHLHLVWSFAPLYLVVLSCLNHQQNHDYSFNDNGVHLVVEGNLQELSLTAEDEGWAAVALVELPWRRWDLPSWRGWDRVSRWWWWWQQNENLNI